MNIYVINLPQRHDRKHNIQEILREAGFFHNTRIQFVEPVIVNEEDAQKEGLSPSYLSLNKTVTEKIFEMELRSEVVNEF